MKKVLMLLLVVSMLFVASNILAASEKRMTADKPNDYGDCLYDAEVLSFISQGEGKNEIRYLYSEDGTTGPESFIVEDGSIYILDSANYRVLQIDNGSITETKIAGCRSPRLFALGDERYYVLDYSDSQIIEVEKQSEVTNTIDLPNTIMSNDVVDLHFNNDGLVLRTNDNRIYVMDVETHAWSFDYQIYTSGDFEDEKHLSFPDEEFSFSTGKNTTFGYVGRSHDYILIGVHEFVPYYPVIECEYTLRRVSLSGEIKDICVFDFSNVACIPYSFCYIDNAGEVYAMICKDEGVYITKPFFRGSYTSHMDELTARAQRIYENLPQSRSLTESVTSLRRTQVETRANNACTISWTIVAGNLQVSNGSTLPGYLVGKSVGNTVNGIPYCWGHYHSELSGFTSAQTSGKITGNTAQNNGNNNSSFCGMDCAGFASYAYKLGTFYHTDDFADIDKYVTGNGGAYHGNSTSALANMEKMDFLLRYNVPPHGNHIMLFNSYANSLVSVTDATTLTVDDKVSTRSINVSDLNDYVLKSPYVCGGTTSCVKKSTYNYGDNTHWKYCKYNCGTKFEAANHSMVYHYNNTEHWKECSVGCGKSTSHSSHTIATVYTHNINYHWKECTSGCGYTTSRSNHSWVAYNSGYRCSVCLRYESQLPSFIGGISLSK